MVDPVRELTQRLVWDSFPYPMSSLLKRLLWHTFPYTKAYNPNQPRDPAGTATGGRWTSGGGGGHLKSWASGEISNERTAEEGQFIEDMMGTLFPKTLETVKIDDLVSGEDRLFPDTVKVIREQLQKDPKNFPWHEVEIYRRGGRLLVWDGHHKIAAAASLGYRTIPAAVLDVDTEKYSPSQLREPAGTPEGGRFAGGGASGGEQGSFPENRTEWTIPDSGNVLSGKKAEILKMFRQFKDANRGRLIVRPSTVDGPDAARAYFAAFEAGEQYDVLRVFSRDPDGNLNVWHTSLHLPSWVQGQGLAKRFLADSMDLYQDLGVKEITLIANSDVGGYAWAKYGFTPIRDHWITTAIGRAEATGAGDRIKQRLYDVQYADPQAIWDVADMTEAMPNGHPAGMELLGGQEWRGTFRLDDKAAMARFDRYTGRTKKYSTDQPREPAGSSTGGRWRSSTGATSTTDTTGDAGKEGGEQMRSYVTQLAGTGDPWQPDRSKAGLPNFVWFRDHGKVYEIDDKTLIGGKPHMCYMNTFNAVMNHPERDLTYVEGFVNVHGVPVHHAWAVTKDGKVRDYTIKEKDRDIVRGYYGVPIKNNFVSISALKTGLYGVTTRNNMQHVLGTDPKQVVES